MSIKFIHISDLHIHATERRDNRNCRKVVDFIGRHYPDEKPIVLITGDIVDDGKEVQYQNAVSILKPLVNGNHSYGPFGNIYTEESQQLFQDYILDKLIKLPEASRYGTKMEDLYPMVTIKDNVLFVGLDSVVGNENDFLHFASGEVGEIQREKLAIILRRNPGRKVVVYFHHHPFYRNGFKKFVMEMDDAKEVLRILAGLVDFVCFGHKHEAETWMAENNIDWMLASGKTPERNDNYKFQYREVEIDKDSNKVSMITFG
jgi:3',5'-cyclic AMP phosphodiesterase CpdA